ncbi:MAG: Uncharacterized protein G01um101429_383 [Parcubacteria group bacterium Gr01-1014_29]|nr:MAG: Uncharacterized protein G01um101429_383 [Parcubacteria group bacterium Gr01-1014_29]
MQHIYRKNVFLFVLVCMMALTPTFFVSADHTQAHTIQQLQAQITSLLAQITALQERLAASGGSGGGSGGVPPVAACPRLTYNFYLGSTDTDTEEQVSELQKFLASDSSIYPEASVTGYFGPLTEQAVKRFQEKHSIVSSGSPDTTGYGVVGPLTRRRLLQGCQQTVVPPVPPIRYLNYSVTPSRGFVLGQQYYVTAKITDAVPNSPIYFSLQRPDGTIKYDIEALYSARYTDQSGSYTISDTVSLANEGQQGTWVSWVTVGGIDSNKVYHQVEGFIDVVRNSRDARRIADLKQLQLALELYYDANGQSYPVSLYALAPTYIPIVPTDPLGNLYHLYHYVTMPNGCAGNAASPCTGYHMGSSLEVASNSALIYDADYNSTTLPDGINGSDQIPCRPTSAGIVGYCFDVKKGTAPPSQNLPPTISGVSGPTVLKVGEIGKWEVKAYDPEQQSLKYSVLWGDEGSFVGPQFAPSAAEVYTQTTTFTHRYANTGTYTPTFTVTDNQGLFAKTSISVNVGSVESALKVTAPNGGETWTKGTTQTIRWQDNTPFPTPPPCQVGTICPQQLIVRLYNIKLVPYYPPCIGEICPALYPASYTIANSVYDSSYNWSVGKIMNSDGTSGTAPDGSYTIQICQTNSTTCDSSDSYFKIVIGGTTTNNSPVISLFPAIPSEIKVGQPVSFSWWATDADGDNLAWSVSWGEGIGMAGICQSPNPQNKQNWAFTAPYTWQKAGTYTVKATVNDCRGGSAEHAFNVTVGATTQPSITVLYPNGGEQWQIGSTQTIRWASSNFPSDRKIDVIRLRDVYGKETDLLYGTINDGIEQIIVPSVPSIHYTLEIKTYSTNGELIFDASDRAFSIVVGKAIVTSFGANPQTAPSDGIVKLSWSGIYISKYTLFTHCPFGVSVMYEKKEWCNQEADMGQNTSMSGKFTNTTQQNQYVQIELRAYGAAGTFDHAWTLGVDVPPSTTTAQPSLTITASSAWLSSQSALPIQVGDTLTISGMPQNLGSGFSRAFFFDPIFNASCTNNSASETIWTMQCTANQVGTSNFYVEIYQNGQTYRSNTVQVTVGRTPDLTAAIEVSPNPMIPDQPVKITRTVKNVGTATAYNVGINVKNLSNNWEMSGYGGVTLAPGQEYKNVATLSDTSWATCANGGINAIRLIVDLEGLVAESNESNNVATINVSLSGCGI